MLQIEPMCGMVPPDRAGSGLRLAPLRHSGAKH